MAKIKVNRFVSRPAVIVAPEQDRVILQFQTPESSQNGEPYNLAMTLRSGLELLGLLEQARVHHQLPKLTPLAAPFDVPPEKDQN